MIPSRKSVFERIVAFKKVCEDDEHFLTLIWGTRVECALSNMGGVGSGGLSFRIDTYTHRICPPKVEGVVIQEFGRGCGLLSGRTRDSV